MSHKAFCLKNKKCKLWNRYIANRSVSTLNSYCKIRNELCNLTRNLRYTHEKKLVSNCNYNSKHFWKYVNSCLRSRPVVNILKNLMVLLFPLIKIKINLNCLMTFLLAYLPMKTLAPCRLFS